MSYTPKLADAKGFTAAEMRGIQRLVDRIKFDLYAAPDTPNTWPWRDRQESALIVIEERLANGR